MPWLKLTFEQWYEHAHNKPMPLKAIARLIQTMLYGRRFFPYYVYNILGGIEEDGQSITSRRVPFGIVQTSRLL
jgi:20S proteasome subunit beta 6